MKKLRGYMHNRKRYSKRSDIPADVLQKFHTGEYDPFTLAEILAVDFAQIFKHCIPEVSADALACLANDAGMSFTKRMETAGAILFGHCDDAYEDFSNHKHSMIRSWSAYALACDTQRSLDEQLALIKRLADDEHQAVRECAWVALRPAIIIDIHQTLELLEPWTRSERENVRRFAVEATRPRGVWCAHSTQLKREPAYALNLLENVRSDSARYVQNAVGNWLNDASKDHPDWVSTLCERWQNESPTKETAYICKRALRTIMRK